MFSAPLWLYALAALAIPLALHLWSRRPRAVVRVGSLRHIEQLSIARSWSARLTDPLLLAVRLALLAAVTLALAGPRMAARQLGGSIARLVLIEPDLFPQVGPLVVEALLDSGITIRVLSPGLPRITSPGALPAGGDSVDRNVTLWDLLTEADQLVEASGRIDVFAYPRQVRLGGRRPGLRAAVVWHAPVDTVARSWTAARWWAPGDSVFSILGQGRADGITYSLARSTTRCSACTSLVVHRLALDHADSSESRRLAIAAQAVAQELGQDVVFTTSDSAEGFLTTDPKVERSGVPTVSLAPEIITSDALADSLLWRWPWLPLAQDRGDPRVVAVAQAVPGHGARTRSLPEPRRMPLFALAVMLFLLERWLATRPFRGEA